MQENLVLYTSDLQDEIAYSVFSIKLNKVGLGRNLDQDKLIRFFEEINQDNIQELGLINVNIIGGNDSEESKSSLERLILQLQDIDNNRNIINIRSLDTCTRLHPDSFQVDCYHGGIHAIQSANV